MTQSSTEIALEADAARLRLGATLDRLRENLTPSHLTNEIFEGIAGPSGSSALHGLESVIREHPLPMMLVSAGGVLWLRSGFGRARDAGELSAPAAAAGTLKENIAVLGGTVIDNAYGKFKARLLARVRGYAQMAAAGLEGKSGGLTQSIEGHIDTFVSDLTGRFEKHPLLSSAFTVALGLVFGNLQVAKKA